MAKTNNIGGDDFKLVKLVVYPKRRLFVVLMAILTMALFAAWIAVNLKRHPDASWVSIASPIIVVGCLLVFILPAEEWRYSHWQDVSQKNEKNIYD